MADHELPIHDDVVEVDYLIPGFENMIPDDIEILNDLKDSTEQLLRLIEEGAVRFHEGELQWLREALGAVKALASSRGRDA